MRRRKNILYESTEVTIFPGQLKDFNIMMVFHTLWCIFLCLGYSVGVIALLQTQDLKRRGKRKT